MAEVGGRDTGTMAEESGHSSGKCSAGMTYARNLGMNNSEKIK